MQNRICEEFNNAGTNVLNGLFAFFKGRAPAFSFRESVEPVRQAILANKISNIDIDQFDAAIQESERKARSEAEKWEDGSEPQPAGLTADHVAVIALYSYAFMDNSKSFFRTLNRILRMGGRDEVRPFAEYVWLLLHAMKNLPESRGDFDVPSTVYRGIDVDVRASYIIGQRVVWPAFSSTSADLNVQQKFCQNSEAAVNTLFIINLTTRRARSIKKYSLESHESEVLLPPNSQFVVKAVTNDAIGGKTALITLQEIPSEDPILHYGITVSPDILRRIRTAASVSSPEAALTFVSTPTNVEEVLVCKTFLESLLAMLNEPKVWEQLLMARTPTLLVFTRENPLHALWPLLVTMLRRHAFPAASSAQGGASISTRVAIAEVGLSLFRKLCRRGATEDADGHQSEMVSRLSSAGVVDLAVDVLRELGPGNARIAVQCLALLHFLMQDDRVGSANREAVGRLQCCECIWTSLIEHGAANRFIANHGLWCLHYLRSVPDCRDVIQSAPHGAMVSALLSNYEVEFSRAAAEDASPIFEELNAARDMPTLLLCNSDIGLNYCSRSRYFERLALGLLHGNCLDENHLLNLAECGVHLAEAFQAIRCFCIIPTNKIKGSEYARRCWSWLQSHRSLVPVIDYCIGRILGENIEGLVVGDKSASFACIRSVAESGYSLAQNIMGYYYYHGNGVVADKTEAVRWYLLAADQGYAAAQCNLGCCYEYGHGVVADKAEAVLWYRLSAGQGYAEAQNSLGNFYKHGHGVVADKAEAVRLYHLAADQEYAAAQYNLAVCYNHGHGVVADKTEAVRWYRLAADQGYAEAQINLGNCYYHGHGILADKAEAVRWYRLAADQGYAVALNNVGICYEHGHGVAADKAKAVRLYSLAADQGYAIAQKNLGNCYEHGHGVVADKAEAMCWYRLAADQGFAVAQSNLGNCYYHGHGVVADKTEAVRWYRLAADQGFVAAQNHLGYCYEHGHGVVADKDEAVRWYRLAADRGNAVALQALKRLRVC